TARLRCSRRRRGGWHCCSFSAPNNYTHPDIARAHNSVLAVHDAQSRCQAAARVFPERLSQLLPYTVGHRSFYWLRCSAKAPIKHLLDRSDRTTSLSAPVESRLSSSTRVGAPWRQISFSSRVMMLGVPSCALRLAAALRAPSA